MKKIKVLWMSNKRLVEEQSKATGTWLMALSGALAESGQVELGVLAHAPGSVPARLEKGGITHFDLPQGWRTTGGDGLPVEKAIKEIKRVVEVFNPDIIHTWGTELYWGLLVARRILPPLPALLDIQGLKGEIAKIYDGGMTFAEKLMSCGPKEILRGSTIFQGKEQFKKWGRFEQEIMRGHRFVTTQSEWLEAHVGETNPKARRFHNEFALQEAFYKATGWQQPGNSKVFCSTSYPSPFKGLHVAIRAAAMLKRKIPEIQLRIAGAHQKAGLRQDGFVRWLNREAKRLGVEKNLAWLGAMSVEDILHELQTCSACLLPTFIEGYSLTLAEAMMVGTPTAVSYVGGSAHLAKDEETALFFPPGDAAMCAYQVERLLKDHALAERLSEQARKTARVRNEREEITRRQIEIYRQVLEEVKNG